MPPNEKTREELRRAAYAWLEQQEPEKQKMMMEAKRLWVAANVALGQGNIREYFKKADELHQYMSDQKLSPDDLRPLITGISITPASFSRLEAIYGATSAYSVGAATIEDSTVENSFISAIAKKNAFFMDCRLKKNERATPDETVHLSTRDVVVDIMKHIRDVASPQTRIGDENLKELMTLKIRTVKNLPTDDPDSLKSIYARKKLSHVRPVHSTLNINKVQLSDAYLEGDWQREAKQNRMLINGISLNKIAENYENFESQKDVLLFFNEVILKDFTGTQEHRDNAIGYLSKVFHQGGIMYPVSLAVVMTSSLNAKAAPTLEGKNINILTTENGFVIQECCSFKSARMPSRSKGFMGMGMGMSKFADEEGLIMPEDPFKPLITAEGTIEVDFSKNPADPSLTIKSNTIEVNHSELVKYLDTRHFLQKFIDALKAFFGFNKVEHTSIIKERLLESKAKAAEEDTLIEAKSVELDSNANESGVEQQSPPDGP